MTMKDVVDVMLDVSALVTRGSDLARNDARRVAAEHERRANEQARRVADQVALLPVSIIAVGGVEQPVERLMTLQSAISRAVHMAAGLGRLRLRLPRGRLSGIPLREPAAMGGGEALAQLEQAKPWHE